LPVSFGYLTLPDYDGEKRTSSHTK
jgi:hypothetical protein